MRHVILSRGILLALLLFFSPALWGQEYRRGLYIGSFDPPTLGHKLTVLECMRRFGLAHVYISVNYATDKDFNASMQERIDMLELMFADIADKVTILREPLAADPPTARRLLARSLLEGFDGKLIGIFGDDTYEKNFKIFAGIRNFDFIHVERPEVTAQAESVDVYDPIEHEMILSEEADGLSSSLARDQLLSRLDTSKTLDAAVARYIAARGLYTRPGDPLAFVAGWQRFAQAMEEWRPGLRLETLPFPTFKPYQSVEAQWDKYVRHSEGHLAMTEKDRYSFRQMAEHELGIRYLSRPFDSRSGVYLGSFDLASADQALVVEAALAQGNLDSLYVGVLESSKRPLDHPWEERFRSAQQQFRRFGERVTVVRAPALAETAPFVRALRAGAMTPLLAVFGDPVFDDNHRRLKDITRVNFAVAPVTGAPARQTPYPSGTLELKLGCGPSMAASTGN